MGHYASFFWCVCGSHYVAKETAVVSKSGVLMCPKHRRRLRTHPSYGGEERDRLYPRSRAA